MKQLKFMLAAATALGLATASQAGEVFKDNFDTRKVGNDTPSIDLGTDVTKPDLNLGYTYTPIEGSGENYSAVAEVAGHDSQVLNVDTDGTPLIRSLGSYNISAKSVYIDTLVKFTVTPEGDEPDPGTGDKLMIYVEEIPAVTDTEGEVVTPASNQLVVMAAGDVDGNPDKVRCKTGFAIDTTKWYHLYVEAVALPAADDKYYPCFKVSLAEDGDDLELIKNTTEFTGLAGIELEGFVPDDYFPSLELADSADGVASPIVKEVGFAGEGWIDDLAFGTVDVVTGIDFTLTVNGASAVWTTINGTKYYRDNDNGKIELPNGTTTFTLEYDAVAVDTLWNPQYAAALSEAANCEVDGLNVKLGEGAPYATLTVTATETGSAPTVTESTKGSDVGITGGAFKDAEGDELRNVLNWAVARGQTKAVVSAIAPFEDETGNATNLLQEAYLLNCPVDENYIKNTVKPQFKFAAFTVVNGVPTYSVTDSWTDEAENTFKFNGTVEIHGATTLKDGGDWQKDKQGSFYKAVLTK